MKHHVRKTVLLCLIAGISPLFAQRTNPSAPKDTETTPTKKVVPVEEEPKPTDDTITLTPFEVTTSKDYGYTATETLGGSRIRTNLADVAASLTVIDKQFLDDIGAVDNGTLLQFATNTEVAGTMSTYSGVGQGQTYSEANSLQNPQTANRVRGLASADNTRNFYTTDIPFDTFNVDRLDLLRGPNAILYGLGSPAGIINSTTRNAEFRNQGQVSLRTGSFGSVRGSLDLNQQIIPNQLAIRIDGLWSDTKYEQKPAFEDNRRIYGALRYDPKFFKHSDFHTSVKANFEHGQISADHPRTIPPGDSITPWWRPTAISATNPFGGAGQSYALNPYAVNMGTAAQEALGSAYGVLKAGTPNYQPWLGGGPQSQQDYYLFDASNGQFYGAYGGINNAGAVTTTGAPIPSSSGVPGIYNTTQWVQLQSLPSAANAYQLPGYQYGQYKTMSIMDPSIFNFYNTLIDGPTSSQNSKWNAANIDFSVSALGDRIALDVTYDRQRYTNSAQALLSSPTINIDLNRNFQYYPVLGVDGITSISNPNYGRPFVSGTAGGGNEYSTDREVARASLFFELRASDFTKNSFLQKLLGKHRFNIVASNEKYWSEAHNWAIYANSPAWNGYWNGNSGATDSFTDRAPAILMYLGGPVTGLSSASGANIPGIRTPIYLANGTVYSFNPAPNGNGAALNLPWNVPPSLYGMFAGIPSTVPGATTQLFQNSNPANLIGWTNVQNNLITSLNGQNHDNWTAANLGLRETRSYAGNYQGYFWKNAFVATLGWRFDEVDTKNAAAPVLPLVRNTLDLNPADFALPGAFPPDLILKAHSVSGGAVLHLNDLLPRDPLPFGIGITYNDSSNFQVTSVRRDVFGTGIPNPTGKTKEYGVLLSTKDGRFSLRVTKYDTLISNGASTLGNAGGLGSAIAAGLRWRNVFLYQLGAYTLDTQNQASYRNSWTNAFPQESAAQAQADEDAAITAWNNFQKYLAPKGFFPAWNFVPTTQSVLVDRTTYLANPAAYQPDPASVGTYTSSTPPGFTVTSDTESKGYEFDFTANPLKNWRISFNAHETQAIQTNVGGAALTSLMAAMDKLIYNPDGTFSPAGQLPEFGGANGVGNQYASFRQAYTLLVLQQGSPVSELRKWGFNVVTNYTFDHGVIKGLGIGGSYRWQDRNVIGYPMAGAGSYDLTKPYWGPREGYIGLFTSYHFKLSRNLEYKVQLNIDNVGSRNGLIPVSVEPDGRTWAAVRTKPVEQWALTNTLSF